MVALISSSQSSHLQIEIQRQAASRSGIVNMQAPVYRLAIVWMWCYCMPQIADILQSLIFIRDNYHYDTCLWHINDRIVLLPPQKVTSLFPMLRLLRADITHEWTELEVRCPDWQHEGMFAGSPCMCEGMLIPLTSGQRLVAILTYNSCIMGSVLNSNLLGNSLMSAMAFL